MIFLAVFSVLTVGPGLIHSFLPDGGAESIAGMTLGEDRETVIGTFAWAGATQIVWGIAMMAVALRYPTLAPLILALVLLERILLVVRWWIVSPPSSGHHPPEHYTSILILPLLALFLTFALRRRRSAPP
ncbi:MAG: hypothetical protein KAG62_14315 [Caulobacter sp.]|uniref:hypothetical protein n=1 Tax=Phenylobacterium sp. TaxID=1871053 RepID=UPI0035B4DB1C|nr:hypothetical protein [Caulobacter sp.]